MAKDLIFGRDEARFLRELVRRKVDFMIVGLSAAALQGAPVVTQDVDLWFRDLGDARIRKALDAVGGIYVPPTASTPPMFAGDSVNLFDIVVHMHGLQSFGKEAKRAAVVSVGQVKVKALPLERIIESKKATGRHKDRLALPVLRDALRSLSMR